MSETPERTPRGPVALATAAVAAVHLAASAVISHPTVVYDENGYLGNARHLAGAGAGWEMAWSPRYSAGYPLVIAPLTRLVGDPALQWRAILALNAVLLALLVPLLTAVGRRLLGLAPTTALTGAVVGALVPAAIAASPSAIAENLVLPLVPAVALALERAVRPGRLGRRIWFGPAVALLYAAHPRFTVAVPLGAAVVVVAAWRRLAPAPVVGLNLLGLALGSSAAWALNRAVERARWDHVERLEGTPADVARLARSASGVGELAATLAGQVWYLAVGSLGLVVVGVAVVAGRVRASGTPDGEAPPSASARLALGVTLVLAVAVLAVSVAFFAQNQFRADHWVYGRHNDSFTPIWVLAAVGALLTRPWARLVRPVALAATVIVGTFAVVEASRDAEDLGSEFSAFAVPALIRAVDQGPPGTFGRATLWALVGLAAISVGVGAFRRPRVVVGALLAWSVWLGLGPVAGTDLYEDIAYADWQVPDLVEDLGVTAIEVDGRGGGGFAGLAWPFHLPGVRFTTYEPALGETPTETFVLARTEDEHLASVGARIVLLDQGGAYTLVELEDGMALWVQPGPAQDRLAAEGRLLPAGFPTGLPAAARRADLAIVDRAPTVRVRPGGSVALTVRGRHAGSGSPWPDQASYGGPARVRVVAEITPEDAADPPGGRSGGELSTWTLPGDTFTTRVEVFAVDTFLQPLPPGRYRVELVVGQDEPRWGAGRGPGASFTLVVAR